MLRSGAEFAKGGGLAMRTTRYLALRAANAATLLFAVSILVFGLTELVPGDFTDDLRLNPDVSPATVDVLRQRYGLDRSVAVQYWRWAESVAGGEFGFSVLYGRPVGPLLRERALNTLLLSVTATVLAWCVALPVGAWSARYHGRVGERAMGAAVTGVLALPDLLVALILLMVAVRIGGIPAGGLMSGDPSALSPGARLVDLARHLVLPVLALALVLLPALVRHVRDSLIEAIDAPFVQAAKAMGVGDWRLVYRHALRAAAGPLIPLFGLSVAGLLSASVTIEAVMSWPGLGPLLLDAIHARDVHLVVGVTLVSTLFVVGGNLLADGLLYLADPRVRAHAS
jgi:peptide/nickel transport system permease protein